ncbi:hypothetical protein Lalb_Chr25g0289001 [Lupinus albus]|uniref:Membrane magnesium transporter n=1 Tax=Lupinus albus TaxID=3870 RepID=A0A6A4MWW3_LUPAL|nr:hypothetical protein Lalb_Chr25g0289001 [Lupinus albus]
MGFVFTMGLVGVLIFFHAAYSTIQYRGLLKITEEEFSGPPFNVNIIFLITFASYFAKQKLGLINLIFMLFFLPSSWNASFD